MQLGGRNMRHTHSIPSHSTPAHSSSSRATQSHATSSATPRAARAPKPRTNLSGLRTSLSGLRHQLLTPLNHIVGYSELLLEDAPESGFSSSRQHLTRIRETARGLARFVQTNFVQANLVPARGREKRMAGLCYDLDAPLHTILQAVGAITSDPASNPGGDDVMKIGRAAAELLSLIHARVPRPAPPVERPARERKPKTALEPGRILVVDDNKSNRDLLARQLRREGHRVTEAASGAEALALLTENPQDLVLLDMLMPKLDGFQVLARIKADPALAPTPVVVVSALDEIPGIAQCIEMGADDYLFKPIDPALLRARIRASLERKRALDREKRRTRDLEDACRRMQLNEEWLCLALEAGRAQVWEWDVADRAGLDKILQAVHPADRPRVRERLLQAVERKNDFHEHIRLSDLNGSPRWADLLGTLHLNERGRPERMLGLYREITREKRMEDDLHRSHRMLEEFTVAAPRDLQEPLRSAIACLERCRPRLRGEDARSAAETLDSLRRMSARIAELLDDSRIPPAARKR